MEVENWNFWEDFLGGIFGRIFWEEFFGSDLVDPHIQALVDNLIPTILKVDLDRCVNLKNEHVKKLVKRCNNITHLDLTDTAITSDSVH